MAIHAKTISAVVIASALAVALAMTAGALPAFAQERQAAAGGDGSGLSEASQPGTTSVSPQVTAQIQYGRGIAVSQCSSCHALDNEAESPNPAAPPLRNVLWRFKPDPLATYFIEALRVGHGDMPIFDFTPIGADALIAYLKSIRTPRDVDEK